MQGVMLYDRNGVPILFDAAGHVQADVLTSALPTGAATEATLVLVDAALAGGLPAALAASGGLKVEGVAGGVPQPVAIDQTTPGTTNAVAIKSTTVMDVDTDGAAEVALKGKQVTLLAETTITTDSTTNVAAVTGLDKFSQATILLVIAGKVMDAATTLDLYLQYSPDGGTTWDDLAHFAQVTSAAIGNGSYVLSLNGAGSVGFVDRAVTDGTLAANSIRNIPWCDRIRVKRVSANFSGTDTIAVTITGYFQ